jgi:hypothetical protein
MATLATIGARASGSGGIVIDLDVAGKQKSLPIDDGDALRQACEVTGQRLREIVADLKGVHPPVDKRRRAFERLLGLGRKLGRVLSDADDVLWGEIVELWQSAWPVWGGATTDIPVVEVRAPGVLLPFELLPLFATGGMPSTADDAGLLEAADRFLGFRAVVRRLPPGDDPQVVELSSAGGLPVQVMRYRETGLLGREKYRGFDDEPKVLARAGIDVEGPWPSGTMATPTVVEHLIDALYDPKMGLDGAKRAGLPAQLQHFVCHCHTDASEAGEFYVKLSSSSSSEYRIDLDTIGDGYTERRESGRPVPAVRAPVVMNACGSSRVDPTSSLSFPKYFLRNGHRAFVGTLTKVPDSVAPPFAERLYRFLLAGYTLGESLVLARRRLLVDKKTPLGLLYVLYGNDLVGVSDKRPAVAPTIV